MFVNKKLDSKIDYDKKCNKYLLLYGTSMVLSVANILGGAVINEVRPDIGKKLLFASIILLVGAVASILEYFRNLKKSYVEIPEQNIEPKSNGNFKISKELNKLLDGIVRTNVCE